MFWEREKLWKQKKPLKRWEIYSFIIDIIVIIAIVIVIKTFFILPFVINWQSMYKSYYDKEFIIVDKFSYLIWEPKRWDVIVFKPWIDKNKKYFLKRIIWIPWDSLKIKWGNIYIKTKNSKDFIKLKEDYLSKENKWNTFVWANQNIEKIYDIWAWEYFVMWDNRKHSTDSRECFSNCIKRTEFITKADMVWKVLLDLWYFNIFKFQFLHPDLWIKTTPRFFSSASTFDYKELENK